MRTPTGHSPRQHALADCGESRCLDWMISREFRDSRIFWCVRCWPPQTLWDAVFTVQSNQQPTGLPSHVKSVWPSEALGRSQERLPKRPSPGSFSLAEEHKPPENWSAVSGAGSAPERCARGFWAEFLRWDGQGRAVPACPGTAMPCPAAGMGQLRQLEAGAARDPSSRNTIQECHLLGPGQAAVAAPAPALAQVWGGDGDLQLPEGFLLSSLPRGSWGSLCQGRAGSPIVTEMRSNRRVSPRKACFLNPSCYSMELRKSPQRLSGPPRRVVRDDRVGALCRVNLVNSSFYVHEQVKHL